MRKYSNFLLITALLLLLSGCSNASSWSSPGSWFGDSDEKDKKTKPLRTTLVAQPGQSTGLVEIWNRSVASSPDSPFFHPGRFVVTGSDIFVATYQGAVVHLSRKDGSTLWKKEVGQSIKGGVGIDDKRVFTGTDDGEMVALSQATGEEVWRQRVSTSVTSAPVAADGKIFFLTLDSRLYALNAETGATVWVNNNTPEALVIMGAATPTVDQDRLFVGYSSGDVQAVSISNGKVLWNDNLTVVGGRSELDLLQDIDAAIVTDGRSGQPSQSRKVFAVNHQGRLVALSRDGGSRSWTHDLSALHPPLVWNDRLFIADMDGTMRALGMEDGLELWRGDISDGLLTAPVRLKDRIVIADNKGRLFSLDPTSGRVLGLDRIGDPVLADPMVVGQEIYLWTNKGNMIALRFP
ncbi:MAG: outer membrane protein assembly factor BamB [Magnetococcales bacterium]|nr:outer membrane protein assembly factor BamB [Magnetococcales bacterium]